MLYVGLATFLLVPIILAEVLHQSTQLTMHTLKNGQALASGLKQGVHIMSLGLSACTLYTRLVDNINDPGHKLCPRAMSLDDCGNY